MKHKILFLDIDGVLNHKTFLLKFHEDAGNASTTRIDEAICPEALNRLRRIVEVTQTFIVISSTWRIGRDAGWFVGLFARKGWENAPIIGVTPSLGCERGEEVIEWLAQNDGISRHVILDDDGDFHPWQPLVQTNWEEGLLDTHVEEAISILEGDSRKACRGNMMTTKTNTTPISEAELLNVLDDENWKVRHAAASSPSASEAVLMKAMDDEEREVRHAAARNPSASDTVKITAKLAGVI